MSKDRLKRIFYIADDKMFEAAKAKRTFFIQDKADFIAFDADFADPFAADLLTDISAAEIIPTDETVLDQITQYTAAVEAEMQLCRKKFQDTKYFIDKAFPDNPGVQNEFGYNDYSSVRDTQTLLIQFMRKFHTVATKYKVQLIAAGYGQPKIDEIKTRGDKLDNANNDQEVFMDTQVTFTQDRVTAYNGVWEKIITICTAGKRIYNDNFGKYQRYLLPPGEESPAALSIFGKATDSITAVGIDSATVLCVELAITINTDATGTYEFGGLPDGTYTLKFNKAAYNELTLTITIAGGVAVEKNVQMVHV